MSVDDLVDRLWGEDPPANPSAPANAATSSRSTSGTWIC